MNVLIHKIDVTCKLELTARDVELLECLTSYDNKKLLEGIFGPKDKSYGVSYNGGVKFEELEKFLDKLKGAAGEMKAYVNEHALKGLIR